MATRREATIPRLAPAPTTLPAHFQPFVWKAIEKDALSDIYESCEECLLVRKFHKLDLIQDRFQFLL